VAVLDGEHVPGANKEDFNAKRKYGGRASTRSPSDEQGGRGSNVGCESQNRGPTDRLETSARAAAGAASLDSTEWPAESLARRSFDESRLINLAAIF